MLTEAQSTTFRDKQMEKARSKTAVEEFNDSLNELSHVNGLDKDGGPKSYRPLRKHQTNTNSS